MQKEMHQLFDLSGKVAVVTGGGSGLGREFCDVLAEFGADVVCPDIYPERAAETCALIGKYGHKTLPLGVDVADYDQVAAMFRRVMDTFGKLDILVNNAGVAPPSVLIDETELKDWHRVIDVDLNGVFYCMKEGLKIMRQQESGVVINISSTLGIAADMPDILAQSPYAAAKHGVIGLTRQGAAEYGQFGVRVNCIAPGFHQGTRLPESMGADPRAEERGSRLPLIKARTPLGRMGNPDEIKGILLLAASDASSFMTGAVIVNDGGMTIW